MTAPTPSKYNDDWRRWTPVLVGAPLLGPSLAALQIWQGSVTAGHVVLLALGYLLTLIGVEIGYHRHFTHDAFQSPVWIRYVLGALGSMSAQGPLLYWVSTHRRHHKHADREGDPHSPHVRAGGGEHGLRLLWHAHVGWIRDVDLAMSYRFLPRTFATDRLALHINRNFFGFVVLGLLLPALVGAAIPKVGFWAGLVWGGLFRIFLVQHATFVVNSICHRFGYRRFPACPDASKNNLWLVLPTLGGALHNNHHADPRAARTSMGGYEFDPGYWIISGLQRLGLAEVGTVGRRARGQS